MPHKPMHFKVGVFSMLALVLLVAAVGLLASGVLFRNSEDYLLYFEGSVAGLSVGAPVVFRGVPLGRVTSISMVVHDKDESVTIPVGIDIFEENIRHKGAPSRVTDAVREAMIRRMVEHGLRARIAVVSFLTGQARVELDFFPDTPARYHTTDFESEIPTLSSPLEEFSRALAKINIDKIAHNFMLALDNFNKVITSEELQGALAKIRQVADEASVMMREMPALVQSGQNALQRIESAADRAAHAMPKLSRDMSLALDKVSKAAERAESLFLDAGRMVSPTSATGRDLQSAVRELAEAARAVRSLAKSLERNPESLLRGKGRQQP